MLFKTVKDSLALSRYFEVYGNVYADEGKTDSSLQFFKRSILSVPAGASLQLSSTYRNMAMTYAASANFPAALTYYQKALSIAETANDETGEAYIYLNMGVALMTMQDYKKAEQSYLSAIKFARKTANEGVESTACYDLGIVYNYFGRFKEAYTYAMNGARLAKNIGDLHMEASCLANAAAVLAGFNKLNEAEELARQAITIADSSKDAFSTVSSYGVMGMVLKQEGKNKQAIRFLEKFSDAVTGSDMYDPNTAVYYEILSECYEKTGNFSKALEAYKTATTIEDTLKNIENIRKATELAVSYDFKKKQELAKAMQDKIDADTKRKRTQQYFIIAGLTVVVLAFVAIALIQFRNNKQKQKANALLHYQKKEIEQQKEKVENTLIELKSTQAQLIQSEKMASLGELTAGIAHEIQNPLNFVNNFSEVNKELISELVEEVDKGNTKEVKTIANDIKANEEKINHHGKRADAIVKGMLQHSRQTSGTKEPTDINALCDEYIRLCYHGLRAKDNSFNATIKTDFDNSIEKVNIIPQDIGRVLLNILTNAFYAVNEKKKQFQPQKGQEIYEPTVSVSTKSIKLPSGGLGFLISLKDNGNGIPEKVFEKIFQPFFTTKPTGQGTGLGLSLSYDIVKAHGGEIKVETKNGEGSEFIIELPVK